jgi:hypothetical protein
MKRASRWLLVLFGISFFSCALNDDEAVDPGDMVFGSFWTYLIEYHNNTGSDLEIKRGKFFIKTDGAIDVYSKLETFVMEAHTSGLVRCWWYLPFAIPFNSFYISLEVDGTETRFAGWPESLFQMDSVKQYGIGYAVNNTHRYVTINGEEHLYISENKQNGIVIKAELTINDGEDLTFDIIGDITYDFISIEDIEYWDSIPQIGN